MHDMTAKKAAVTPVGQHPNYQKHHKQFPTRPGCAGTRRAMCRFLPSNMATPVPATMSASRTTGPLSTILKIAPHYGVMPSLPPVDVKLFGRSYSAPIGVAPMGGPSLVWPGADLLMAKAAQRARIPYTLSVAGGCHHRAGGGSRARCVLAPALSVLARRSQDWLRSRSACASGRCQGPYADPRCAGAHDTLARNLCRACT